MGELTKAVIRKIETARAAPNLEGWIWKASDLLAKTSVEQHHSGCPEIDDETVSLEERTQLIGALRQCLTRNSDPRFVSQIVDALGSAREPALKQTFLTCLGEYLKQLKSCNGVVYAALQALHDMDESVFETDEKGTSSQSLIEVDKNIRQAHRYLESHEIRIPW